MHKKIGQIVLILLFLMVGDAFAKDAVDSDTVYSLGEVVVTAPAVKGVEAVATSREITAQDIDMRQVKTLDKALELLPGLDIRRGAQGIPRVNIRGFRSRHVILLLNGIPFNSTYDGQFDPATISVENIARIKVAYGNHSVLYGQGGLGGVINIITKKGTKEVSGGAAMDIDERGNYTTRADVSGGNGTMDFFVSGSRQDSDGFLLSDNFDATAHEDGGVRENSDSERNNVYANLGVNANDALRFGVVVGGSQGEFGKPPSIDSSANKVKYERTDDHNGKYGQVSMEYDPDGRFDLRAWGYINKNEEELARYDDDDYDSISKKGSYDRTDESKIYGGTIQAGLDLEKLGRLAFSLNGEKDEYDSNGYEIGKSKKSDIAISHKLDLFSAALEYNITFLDRLDMVTGYSHHWQNKDEGADDDKGSWLLGLSYDLFKNTRLRTSYARKIRFASIKNLYDSSAGNTDLTTEESDNYEFGITQALPYGIIADLAVFRNEMEDYISKDSDDIYQNNDEYLFQGFELLVSKDFAQAGLSLGYSYLEAEDKSQGSTEDDLEYRPTHKITVEGNYAFDFGLTAYAGIMYLMDQIYYDGTDKKDLGDFALVDVKLEQLLVKEWYLYAGVDNLFDENYQESNGFPQAGRTAYAGLKVRF